MPQPKKPLKKFYEDIVKKNLKSPAFEKELEDDERLQKAIEFFEEHGLTIEKYDPKNFSLWDHKPVDKKKAYPNYDQYSYIPGQHDIKKWLLSVKDIYYKQKAGLPYREAVQQSTQGWKKMEIYDFLNWLRFHEEGSHMKYKFAQTWYENGQPGYFLHIKQDTPPVPEPMSDGNAVNDARETAERNEEKRNIIEKQRQKIIGRLDSAEKLLRSPEGQQFAGEELENLMEAIYGLKKKVQLVNKLSVSTRLYEDMIVREANILSRKGFYKAANMLHSVAQTPSASAEGAQGVQSGGVTPSTDSPADPSGAGQSGTPNGYVNLSANDPTQPGNQNPNQPPAQALLQGGDAPTGTAESSPALVPQTPPQPKGISEFIENMNEGNESGADDDLEVRDEEEELMVTEAFNGSLHLDPNFESLYSRIQNLYTQAQTVAPPGVPPAALEDVPITDDPAPARGNPVDAPELAPEAPKASKTPKGGDDELLEVTEDDIPKAPGSDPAVKPDSGFDAKIDAMMANVTIADIVAELEDLSKVFKVREIPRRLSIVDMMLDSKGLASYFPSLSEAQNRALEANNYISTRVEDILSKLRGSMPTKDIDLKGGPGISNPEVDGIKGKLEQDDAKEKQRKQMRKEQEVAEIDRGQGKETPEVEMGELAPPTPQPAAPVAAPARTPAARPLV